MNTETLANKIRLDAVRMTHLGKSSHIGSVLSVTDIIAVLYGEVLNKDPDTPKMKNRDRFILSKGHAGAGVYAALAETGYLEKSWLDKHYQNGTIFSGHVSHKGVPGVELSTGSLGHGLPVAAGMAYAAKLDNKQHRVFVVMSDGECDEGSNWESVLFSSHHKLDNLNVFIDYNKLQSIKSIEETLSLEPFAEKWSAFGWCVIEVDGHNHQQIKMACEKATNNRPRCVIAHTIKGKGVSFMEKSVLWHYRSPNKEEYEQAVAELQDL